MPRQHRPLPHSPSDLGAWVRGTYAGHNIVPGEPVGSGPGVSRAVGSSDRSVLDVGQACHGTAGRADRWISHDVIDLAKPKRVAR
jgi:hypothetical protein